MKRPIKIERTWVVLGVALSIGLLAAFAANKYITGHIDEIDQREKNRPMAQVMVATKPMKRGYKPEKDDLAVRNIPVEFAPASAVPIDKYAGVMQRGFAYDVNDGETVVWGILEGPPAATFSTRVAKGRRAMSVPVDEISSISGMLEPGDLIDLMVTIGQKDKKITFPLIQSVSVLAAGQRVAVDGANGEKRSYSTITLDTTPDEARRVIIARDSGKITALLRHPDDKVPMSNAKGDVSALLGIQEGTVSAGVPVLYGGTKIGEIARLGDDSSPAAIAGSLAASAREVQEREQASIDSKGKVVDVPASNSNKTAAPDRLPPGQGLRTPVAPSARPAAAAGAATGASVSEPKQR